MRASLAFTVVVSLVSCPWAVCVQGREQDRLGLADCSRGEPIWGRETLSGDWWGCRRALTDSGITFQSELTQFYQGVAKGGQEQRFRYGSKFDLFTYLDTGKMGLWRGGGFRIHAADWQFGQNINADAADILAPANVNLMTPMSGESFAVTTLLYSHQLGGGYVAVAGRVSCLDFWNTCYPDYGRGVDGFMNMAITMPMNAVPSIPLVFNTACLLKKSERGVEGGLFVIESSNVPEVIGLDFPNEVTLAALARKFTDFGGLPGSHAILVTYATGRYQSIDTDGWGIVPGGEVVPPLESGNWMATYLAEQRLWVDPHDEQRYAKLFGKFGFSDAITSPFHCTASVSVEAFGPMNGRPHDRMGIGYFYNGLNGPFLELYRLGGNPLEDVHGGEVYYNAQILPWFNLTADLQVINSPVPACDTTIVFGLRGKMVF